MAGEKIGILTHSIANNFGANLQALSTASYLRNNGFEPFFFHWDSYLTERSKRISNIQLDIHRNFLKMNGFKISEPCKIDKDFIRIIKEENIHNIIVGSDAVLTVNSWVDRIIISRHGIRLKKTTEDKVFPNPFWIPFSSDVPDCKFFYLSPSCQSSNYFFLNKSVKRKMKEKMMEFSFLSARDTYTAKFMQDIIQCKTPIEITPDPVWGFSYNISSIPTKEYIIKKFNIKNDYILFSFYNDPYPYEWLNEFSELAHGDGIETYSLPMPQGYFNSSLPKIPLPIDPIEWFALIKYSRGYVGHNMHPVIVAMHNNVPFFSIDIHGKSFWRFHFEKSSKVYDLLNRLGFSDYRINYSLKMKLTPSFVYSKLKSFDHQKCNIVSQKMCNDYLSLMKNICTKFAL